MCKPETITMTMRELDRMKVIQAVADGHLARWRAAERLGISARHVRRLVLRLLEDGPRGLMLWADGTSLPYTTYDRVPEVDQDAIVENKRLGGGRPPPS